MKFLIICLSVANLATGQEHTNTIPWWYMVVRPLAIATIRTPIDAITQNQQVHNTNLIPTIQKISHGGLSAFYRGAMPRFLSESARSLYMIPTWTYSQSVFHSQYPDLSKEYPLLRKVFAGIAFGVCEALIGTPMNRISVLLNTQRDSFSLASLKNFGLRDFYRGAGLSFFNNSFGCAVYLMSDRMIRQTLKNYHEGAPLQSYDYAIAGLTTSFIYSAITGPMITLSTKMQHALPGQHQGSRAILKTMIQQNKLSGLFAGWHLRFLQLTLFTTIESVFLDRIDRNLD